jgi:hypothetical protein
MMSSMNGADPRTPPQRGAIRAVGLVWTAFMALCIWGAFQTPAPGEHAPPPVAVVPILVIYAGFGLLMLTGGRLVAGLGALFFGGTTLLLGLSSQDATVVASPWHQPLWTAAYFACWALCVWGRRLPRAPQAAPAAVLPASMLWCARALWLLPPLAIGSAVGQCLRAGTAAPIFPGLLAAWIAAATAKAFGRALEVPRPGAVGLLVVVTGLCSLGALCWVLYGVWGVVQKWPWSEALLGIAACALVLLVWVLRDAVRFDKRWQTAYP